MIRLITNIIFILLSLNLIGQQFHFKGYSLEEGLSRSGVYFILQDHAGFLWVGTDGGGVCKFDGYTFKTYNRLDGLASEKIRIIFEDRNQIIWFGTDNGLSYYDGSEFKTITEKEGLINNYIRSITQDSDGNLWIGTNGGISILDPSEKEVIDKIKVNFNLPHKKVRSLLADSNKVWIGTDNGLCLFKEDSIQLFNKKDGLIDDVILNLFKDKSGNLWVGTNKGLSRIDENNKIDNWTQNDGLINNRVRSINEDVYHRIWIGTKEGVSIFDGVDFLNLKLENGLSNERIRCIQSDRFDNIWLGTYFGGIMRFNYKDFIAYTNKDGLISNQILSLAEDKSGDLIIGTIDGVSKIKVKNNKLVEVKNSNPVSGLASEQIETIYKDNNEFFWYGTDAGISIEKDGFSKNLTIEDGLLSNYITVITKVDSIVYVGTDRGMVEIIPTEDYKEFNIKTLSKSDGLAGNQVSFIKEDDKGQIWIGFSDGKISILINGQLINPVIPDEISELTCISFDNYDRVWLGTNGRGLYYGTYVNTSKSIILNKFSSHNQLSSNYIYSLIQSQNELWVGNEKGLNVIEISDSNFNVQSIGLENGFLGLQNNRNASLLDSKGNLWFGTVKGLYSIRQKELKKINKGKKTINYIREIQLNGEHVEWAENELAKGIEGHFNLPVELVLPYDINNISFDFVGINFVAPDRVQYSWKLEGYDNHWTILSDKNSCNYTNLDPGKYKFLLKSTNDRGKIIEEITKFEFQIKKPFWLTWWFRISVILLTLGGIIYYMNYRTKQLLSKQEALESIIKTRTEEITNQKNELEVTKKELEFQHDELTHKSQEITDSILYSRRIQNSLLPSIERFLNCFNDSFIYYRPKDIVSGDFYWVEKHPTKKNIVFFAAADCTGHGVPGAMVSLVCTRSLNSAILQHQLENPNSILDQTNEIVMEAFTDVETGKIINDGMDISLGKLDYRSKKSVRFEFSGAQNSAWIIREKNRPNLVVNGIELLPDISSEEHHLFIIKANKQPIGHFEKRFAFENNLCILNPGDMIYLFTDGYADQFGSDSILTAEDAGKKYKYKPLKNFLLSIQSQALSEQKLALSHEFNRWKQELEQIDDVCIMGVKV